MGGLAATGRERRSGTNERSSTEPARAGTIGPRTDEQCTVLAPRRFRGLCEILFRELTDTGCTRSAHGSPYARTRMVPAPANQPMPSGIDGVVQLRCEN